MCLNTPAKEFLKEFSFPLNFGKDDFKKWHFINTLCNYKVIYVYNFLIFYKQWKARWKWPCLHFVLSFLSLTVSQGVKFHVSYRGGSFSVGNLMNVLMYIRKQCVENEVDALKAGRSTIHLSCLIAFQRDLSLSSGVFMGATAVLVFIWLNFQGFYMYFIILMCKTWLLVFFCAILSKWY